MTGREHHELKTAAAAALSSSWLASQPESFARALLQQAGLKHFGGNDLIVGLEDMGNPLFFLVTGSVEVAVQRLDRELVPIHFVCPGQWFGEHGALAGRNGLTQYRAHRDCSVLSVPRHRLMALAAEPSFMPAAADLLHASLRTYLDAAGDLLSQRPEERVTSKIISLTGARLAELDSRGLVLPLSQEELAAICCVSRATLSKLLRKMSDCGAVEIGYRYLKVRNLAALRACG